MNNIAIQAEGICVKYGDKNALQHLNVTVPEHSVTAILGPNGVGKSTFMRMITGMVKPSKGKLAVLGQQPTWQLNRSIAYLPDRARWYGGHSVAQAIEWGTNLQPGFNPKRAWGLMESLGLNASTKVEGMSKGQQARLMLALCLSRDVPLLVLDEPFSGIDMISREKIIEALIDSFSENKQTVLICTHEIAETESLFDHAIFFNEGAVALSGDVELLRAQHGSVQKIYRQLYG